MNYKDMTKEQKQAHITKYEKICPDFVVNENGGCLKNMKVESVGFCDYCEKDDMKDDHYLCEVYLRKVGKMVVKGGMLNNT